MRDYVFDFIEIFYNCQFRLERDIDFVSLVTKDYSFSGRNDQRLQGRSHTEDRYWDYLTGW